MAPLRSLVLLAAVLCAECYQLGAARSSLADRRTAALARPVSPAFGRAPPLSMGPDINEEQKKAMKVWGTHPTHPRRPGRDSPGDRGCSPTPGSVHTPPGSER